MANEVITTTIAGVLATDIVSTQVAQSLHATPSIFDTVWYEGDIAGAPAIKFRVSGAMTAAAFTEGTGMSFSQWSPSAVSGTVAGVGVTTRVSNQAQALRPETLVRVGEEQGYALKAKIDTDLAALFASFTTSVGTTNTAITAANILSAIGSLNTAKVPLEDRVMVLSPGQYNDALSAAQTLNQFANVDAFKSGVMPFIFGVPVRMTQVYATANAGVDAVGALYQRSAIGFGQAGTLRTNIQLAPAQYDSIDIATVAYYTALMVDAVRGIKIVCRK